VTVVNPVQVNASTVQAAGGIVRQSTTGTSGFPLQNATPSNIVSWTAPNDGQLHQALISATLVVASAETGGQVFIRWTSGGAAQVFTVANANLGTGGVTYNNVCVVDPGATIHIDQNTALTAGAATMYAVIAGI
jgi:hypothetical protein